MALPPNWTSYTTDDGKEYFHNPVTNTTQWERPAWPEPASASVFDVAAAEVFTYEPTAQELETPATLTSKVGMAPTGGPTLTFDNELVSLKEAPNGQIASMTPGVAPEGAADAGGSGGGDTTFDGPSGIAGWALGQAQQLFDVSTEDVVQRLRMVLLPFLEPAPRDKEEFRLRPDFYGPYWIATTAVLFLAATGNFARLLESGDHKTFKPDYSLVSIAAGMIYGCLLAVPLLARTAIFVSGQSLGDVDFLQLICVCGYSLAPVIPVSLLCILPIGFVRWIAVLIGLAISLLFLRQHLWANLNITTAWLKWTMIAAPCVTPVAVLLVYRLHFF